MYQNGIYAVAVVKNKNKKVIEILIKKNYTVITRMSQVKLKLKSVNG